MTTGRLTRQELGWLLAQEARGAAKVLRQDVTLLTQPPPPAETGTSGPPEVRFEVTLNALDDAIGMLTELEAHPTAKAAARRGRIDLAALLCELAPSASLSLEPGSGTEVFGEETELRRMLHVLVSQTNFSGGGHDTSSAPVRIRREGDWVRITVDLGPDVSASTDLERRWLSRMTTRLGGGLELEGGTMSVLLPADASNDQSEVADLRKELVQAQQLGEAYARELAAVFAAGQLPETEATADTRDVAIRRFDLLAAFAAATHRVLSPIFRGLNDELGRLAEEQASGALGIQLTAGTELVAELGRIAACRSTESVETVDIAKVLKEAVEQSGARAARHGVTLAVDAPDRAPVGTRPRALALLLRSLIDHAIAATPRGEIVTLSLRADSAGIAIAVRDGGPAIPATAHADLLEHRVDPASFGRPPGLSLLVAATTASYLHGGLALREGPGGASVVEARLRAS